MYNARSDIGKRFYAQQIKTEKLQIPATKSVRDVVEFSVFVGLIPNSDNGILTVFFLFCRRKESIISILNSRTNTMTCARKIIKCPSFVIEYLSCARDK